MLTDISSGASFVRVGNRAVCSARLLDVVLPVHVAYPIHHNNNNNNINNNNNNNNKIVM